MNIYPAELLYTIGLNHKTLCKPSSFLAYCSLSTVLLENSSEVTFNLTYEDFMTTQYEFMGHLYHY